MEDRTPRNADVRVQDGYLCIYVKLDQPTWPSSTGNSDMLATSGGFLDVPALPDVAINLVVCRRKPKSERTPRGRGRRG